MTIIGTDEEIFAIKNQCDGRCTDGEWCVFSVCGSNCPVDNTGLCMAIGEIKVKNDRLIASVLNER